MPNATGLSPRLTKKGRILLDMHLHDMRLAVIETIRGVVSQSASKIGTCAAYGISCEGWLKVEILEALTRRFSADDDIEILPVSRRNPLKDFIARTCPTSE